MKKVTKFLVWAFSTLIVLYFALIIAFLVIMRPSVYKPYIDQAFSKYLGQTVLMQGKINLTVFPFLGIRAHDIIINNPTGYDSPQQYPYLAKIDTLEIRAKLWPIFKGKFEPRLIVLKKSDITFITDKNKRLNLVFHPSASEEKKTIAEIPLIEIHIKNSIIRWVDLATSQTLNLQDINLSAIPGGDNFVHINADLRYLSNDPQQDFDFNVNFMSQIDWQKQLYKFKSFAMHGKIKQFPFRLKTDATLDYPNQTITGNLQYLDFHNVSAAGDFTATNIITDPTISANLTLAKFQFAKLLDELNIKFQPISAEALATAYGPLSINWRNNQWTLSTKDFTIGDMKLSGEIMMGQSTIPYFDLTFNEINFHQLIPIIKSPDLPFEHFRNSQWHGKMLIKRFIYRGFDFDNFAFITSNLKEELQFSAISTNFADGTVTGNLKIDLAPKVPKVQYTLNIAKVNVIPVLKLLEASPVLRGTLNGHATIETTGLNVNKWLFNSYGLGQLEIVQGAILGLDLNHLLNVTISSILNKQADTTPQSYTPFTSFKAIFKIQKNTAYVEQIILAAPYLQATGSGTLDTWSQAINFNFNAVYQANKYGIPLQITGTLTHPQVKFDHNVLVNIILHKFFHPFDATQPNPK